LKILQVTPGLFSLICSLLCKKESDAGQLNPDTTSTYQVAEEKVPVLNPGSALR
jgi:hypothetical protein